MEIKKGTWVVITTKNPKAWNLSDSMKAMDGKILQLPVDVSKDGTYFRMGDMLESYTWNLLQFHFRLAEPNEIPGHISPNPNYEIY